MSNQTSNNEPFGKRTAASELPHTHRKKKRGKKVV